MTLAEQAERMAGDLRARLPYLRNRADIGYFNQAAALLRQCAEALRKEGV